MNAYKQHFVSMAIHNRWAFRELHDCLERNISDEQYRADNGLYFRSIHGTLVHLLISSRLWHDRHASSPSYPLREARYPCDITSYWSRPPHEWEQAMTDRQELWQRIFVECDLWIDYVKQLDADALMNEETISYFDTDGNRQERNRAETLDHVFNHNTHHRGQITAIITKYGGQEASPVLDISALPRDEYASSR